MNILYIHTHDSGRVFSPYGYAVPTPNLMEFAKDAALFRNCYCAGPTCSPSRAAMLSGTYPHQNGMLGLAQRGFSMDYGKHLVNYLRRQNYHTVLCGIQHEAGWYLEEGPATQVIGYQEDLTVSNKGMSQEELTTWDASNAEAASRWILEYDEEQPFFLSFGMYATHRRFPEQVDESICEDYVHLPYPVPDSSENRHDFARYMTSVMSADRCFGRVMEAVKEKGILEDTIIIFTTDHGLAAPFCKCTLFDQGIGVAFLMRFPGAKANGHVIDGLVSQIDLFPTLCEVLKMEPPDYLEGVSFAPMLQKPETKIRDAVYAEINFHTSYEPVRAVRTERYKYIRCYDTAWLKTNLSNVDESPVKDYLMDRGLKEQKKWKEALYDLAFDVGERHNLILEPEYQEVRAGISKKLTLHMEKTRDPLLDGEIALMQGWKVNRKECETASSKNPDDYE